MAKRVHYYYHGSDKDPRFFLAIFIPLAGSTMFYLIAFCYDIGNYYFGKGHPMKPHRIRMTHEMLKSYKLLGVMERAMERALSAFEMMKFHSDDYVSYLQAPRKDDISGDLKRLKHYNLGMECPLFDGVFEYCQIAATGSVVGARRLNEKKADVFINYSGGMSLARRSQSYGFCYVNDSVLAILELLRAHRRVLYVDIDAFHPLGVEEAFYSTDRVMTLSFHQEGSTGHIDDIGVGKGKGYAVNVPFKDGVDHNTYLSLFKPVLQEVLKRFRPEAIVFQCGASCLGGDRYCRMNLTAETVAECAKVLKAAAKPLLVLGGSGFTLRNVSRCWTYLTATLLDRQLSPVIPDHKYSDYYGPDYVLLDRSELSSLSNEDLNDRDTLARNLRTIVENIRNLVLPRR